MVLFFVVAQLSKKGYRERTLTRDLRLSEEESARMDALVDAAWAQALRALHESNLQETFSELFRFVPTASSCPSNSYGSKKIPSFLRRRGLDKLRAQLK